MNFALELIGLLISRLELNEIFLNIREAELDQEITKEQADELRSYYQSLGGYDV